MQTFQLYNGQKLPAVGFGTWKISRDDAKKAVTTAIDAGYRLIDCAAVYANERQVGEALSEAISGGKVARSDLWLTSKVWVTDLHAADVEPACRKTLTALRQDYLDLYLIHWPLALKKGVNMPRTMDEFDNVPIEETWRAMEALHDKGLVRSIGVANFTERQLKHLLSFARVRPAVDQVEAHVLLQQKRLRDFCASEGIHVTSYSTLGSGDSPFRPEGFPSLLQLPEVRAIAEKSGLSPAQVLLRWAVQSGMSVIPKATTPSHATENLAVADKKLSPEDMQLLAKLDQHRRTAGAFWLCGRSEKEFWDE